MDQNALSSTQTAILLYTIKNEYTKEEKKIYVLGDCGKKNERCVILIYKFAQLICKMGQPYLKLCLSKVLSIQRSIMTCLSINVIIF